MALEFSTETGGGGALALVEGGGTWCGGSLHLQLLHYHQQRKQVHHSLSQPFQHPLFSFFPLYIFFALNKWNFRGGRGLLIFIISIGKFIFETFFSSLSSSDADLNSSIRDSAVVLSMIDDALKFLTRSAKISNALLVFLPLR